MSNVVIIGSGLAGSLLAIYLAKRGLQVDIYEARGDMRKEEKIAAGRSINLALSDRGIAALREVGMDEYMLAEAVPMYGRMIHSVSGKTKLLPYSGRRGEYIYSVSRAGLNIALINEAEKYDRVKSHFNERCIDYYCRSGEMTFESGLTLMADTVIATDGAGSAVRQAMERQLPNFEGRSTFLEHGYKELHIPAARASDVQPPATAGGSDRFLLEPNALHIWPRHQFMMIALPNFGGSFTCTLFLAKKSVPTALAVGLTQPIGGIGIAFDQLTDEGSLLDFFNREFPDAVPLMPTLVEDFFENPTGELGTVRCWPWNAGGKALLLGDSAHAMVPFYGQGMNCAFEDVRVLDSLLSEPPAVAGGLNSNADNLDWSSIFEEYSRLRKINTDAIQDMAEENFYEMRDATADAVFQRKRELETRLEETYPDYFSKYSMVTFREDLPYSVAKEKGNAQDRLLMKICSNENDVNLIDVESVLTRLRNL
ncbi:MAG TPA: NAD(P)/FAD-dependent oxidoreductase [Pyrinomonadaceae bacterium]|nr:NAD(P)/FAD-dependent oxidoreductase [Pyrinomonadaceae bacterium]